MEPMRALLRKIRKLRFRYEPLIAISVRRRAILHNLGQFQKTAPSLAVAPVLKSNAYGHGMVEVAGVLDGEGLPFFCIDSYVEALILRNEGIRTPLLILGYTSLGNLAGNRLKDISFGITSLEELRRLCRENRRPVAIHLKIDTGMHRQGIMPGELPEALRALGENRKVALEGVYSHLADADAENPGPTEAQIAQWNDAVAYIKDIFPSARYFHLGNTAGARYAARINANMMRLGIGLYGIGPDLMPALSMAARITSLRTLGPGEKIGYNGTFTAKKRMVVATIPVGYAEGIDRRLSNVGAVTVGDVRCPIVGRVSMDITSIDVSLVKNPRLDDEVLVISADPEAPNSIARMADACGAIPYELLVHLPAQLRRKVIEG